MLGPTEPFVVEAKPDPKKYLHQMNRIYVKISIRDISLFILKFKCNLDKSSVHKQCIYMLKVMSYLFQIFGEGKVGDALKLTQDGYV